MLGETWENGREVEAGKVMERSLRGDGVLLLLLLLLFDFDRT